MCLRTQSNSLPCQLGPCPCAQSTPIRSSLGLVPMSCTVPASVSDHVTPVPSPSPPVSVTSPPCFVSSGTGFCPTKHHTGYELQQPMALPLDRTARNLPSLKRLTTRISITIFGVTTDRLYILQHVDDLMLLTVLGLPNLRSHCLPTTLMKAWHPTPTTIPYLSL